jgi:Ca-activated chloride channel family protein
MRLKDPFFLILLVFLVPMVWVYLRRERTSRPAVRFSDLAIARKLPPSALIRWRHLVFVLQAAAFCLLAIALARPQLGRSDSEVTTEGIDIMLVLDVSQSMEAQDFKPDNRLAVAKRTILEFTKKREGDRLGLVVFAARAFTKCPLTLDHNVLGRFIGDLDFTDFSYQTAIGTALATAANRLKDSPAKSKVMILATDGANNAGEIPPVTAAGAAKDLGIRIYTIGIGRKGKVPMPVQVQDPFSGRVFKQVQMVESDLDEQTLVTIADATGGKYFRATDAEKLKEIYDQIDKMEKTVIKTKVYASFDEKFYPWLWAGFVLLLIQLFLQHTRFRRIP